MRKTNKCVVSYSKRKEKGYKSNILGDFSRNDERHQSTESRNQMPITIIKSR